MPAGPGGVSTTSRNNRTSGPCVRKQVSKQHHRLPEETKVTKVRYGDDIPESLAGHLARLGESLGLSSVKMTRLRLRAPSTIGSFLEL